MQVEYRLIDDGMVVGEQTKDMDGDEEINAFMMSSDIYDGMDPLQLARSGKRLTWVDVAKIDLLV